MNSFVFLAVVVLVLSLPLAYRFVKDPLRLVVSGIFLIPISILWYSLFEFDTIFPFFSDWQFQLGLFLLSLAIVATLIGKDIYKATFINILLLVMLCVLSVINISGAALQGESRFCQEKELVGKYFPVPVSDPQEWIYGKRSQDDLHYEYLGFWTEINGTNLFEPTYPVDDPELKETYQCIIEDIEKEGPISIKPNEEN